MHNLKIILLIIAFGLLFTTNTIFADQWQPEVKTVRVNNYDMSYVERGKGKPLILVHGGLSDYRTWLPLMAELGETNQTIAVSLRHYYPERWNGKGNDLSIQQHADDLAAFIKAKQLGPVELLGHSRGGLVSMLVANQHPELVDKLVLADPTPLKSMLSENPRAKNYMEKREAVMKQTVSYYQKGNPDAGLKLFAEYIAGPGAWEKTSDTRKGTLRDNSWTQLSHLQDLDTPFRCNNAKSISSPVLLITGERSAPIYSFMNSALQSCFKKANSALIADAGHMMFSANPTAFVFEVQEFISPQ